MKDKTRDRDVTVMPNCASIDTDLANWHGIPVQLRQGHALRTLTYKYGLDSLPFPGIGSVLFKQSAETWWVVR
jgi:hypothetical protein